MAMQPDPLSEKMRQWATMKNKVDTLSARMNHLRDDMMNEALARGERDEKGSNYLALPQPIDIFGVVYKGIKRQARISTVLNNERALKMAKEKGIAGEVVRYEEVIDLDALYEAYARGKLTGDEVDSLFDTKTSYAFNPDK